MVINSGKISKSTSVFYWPIIVANIQTLYIHTFIVITEYSICLFKSLMSLFFFCIFRVVWF